MASTPPTTPTPAPTPAPTQPPTGLRDLYPADLNRLRFIQDAWRRTAINHGFEEIDGPTFEDAALYSVKSGEGILNEVFGVFSGKNPEERARLAAGGNAPYALRPEFTPTLARMYAARAGALPKPTKWFWTQNCFRAERPQRGRLREFYQWNCDIIGLESSDKDNEPLAQARADAECIATCVGLLEGLGLGPKDVRIRLNNRVFLEHVLRDFGAAPEQLPPLINLVDAHKKLTREQIVNELKSIGVAWDPIVRFLEHRVAATFDSDWAMLFGESIASILHERFSLLKQELVSLDILQWCELDMSIARGLAYYTGMVFEVHEASGAERAIAGGGRYDGLIELFGGPPTPAVGFGMGDVVLSLVLQDKGLMPSDDQIAQRLGQRPDAFVISFEDKNDPEKSAAARAQIAPTLAALRRATPTQPGLHARRSSKSTTNVGKLIQDAAKARARYCVIIESATHCTLKHMDAQREDKDVPLSELVERITALTR